MKKNLFFLLTLTFAPLFLLAQTQKLSIEDYNNPKFRAKGLSFLSWKADADEYTYFDTNGRLVNTVASSGDTTTIATKEKLAEILKTAALENVQSFVGFTWLDTKRFTFIRENSLYEVDLMNQKATKSLTWNADADNLDISKNNKAVAYTISHNLYIAMPDGKIKAVSKDGNLNLVYGESVHRQEFGITKGTFWSPNESLLAFYRMDQSMVTNYPLANYRKTPAVLNDLKYPMAGSKSHEVTVGVYNVATEKIVYLKTGEPKEQYLTNITWSPDSKYIYIQVLNRDQNLMKLVRFDAITGEYDKMLFVEKHPKYVEPYAPIIFMPNNPNKFMILSQRDSYLHLYQYNTNGDLEVAYDTFSFPITEVLGFSSDAKFLYFTTPYEFQIEQHAFELNISTGNIRPLTRNGGWHNVKISKSGHYVLDNMSSQTRFLDTRLYASDNTAEIKTILSLENPLKNYKTGEISLVRLKTKEYAEELFARVIKPADFDSKKKYPVLYYVYGGPHAQLVQDKWNLNADMFLMYMASQGYVVFTVDNRGSGNRGYEFECATYRNLGVKEMEDQQIGIDYLKALPFVDSTRMGCFGWSFGGFMTTSMMLKKPNVFKAAVAGGPVIDWSMYEIMYTERYMDTPEQNPKGYENANLLNYVENLKGRLLIIHGLEDDTVLPQHSAAFVNKCIEKGVLVDYFPYPNHPHNVRGKDRIHLYKKIEDYFKRNL